MAKAILTLDEMPKTCGDCPIFEAGCDPHCSLGAEYTLEEIYTEENAPSKMYYSSGYLPNRPKACPLKESEE